MDAPRLEYLRLASAPASPEAARKAQDLIQALCRRDDCPSPRSGWGETRIGQAWAYARDDRQWQGADPPGVFYVYAPDRKGERTMAHLSGFVGVLQVDGYSGYRAIAAGNSVAGRQLTLISRKTKLAEAIYYTLSRWDGLTRFIDDGRVEIDASTVERSIRPIVLNRKNALFAGSDAGAEPLGDNRLTD